MNENVGQYTASQRSCLPFSGHGQKCPVWPGPVLVIRQRPYPPDTLPPGSCARITTVHEEFRHTLSKNQICQGAIIEIPVKNNHSLKDGIPMTENTSYPDDTGQLLKVLVATEHARADALFRKDRRALESLLAKDFVEIGLFGRFSREDFLARILPLFTLHSFNIDDPHVRRTGHDAAEITYRCTEDATMGRNKKSGSFVVTAHYSLIGNLWKISRWEIAEH